MSKGKITDEKKMIHFEVSSISSEEKIVNTLIEEAGIQRGFLDFFIAYIAVTEGKNRNGAIFTKEEMEKSYKTLINTQVNWEHAEELHVGINAYSKMTEYNGKPAIMVLAKFIRGYGYSSYVREIEERHMGGTLRFSMECYAQAITCEKCNGRFGIYDEVCEHIKAGAGRILNEIQFVGTGVVTNPADKKAKSFALASEENKENEMEFEKMYNEKVVELEKANKVNEENLTKVSELEKEVANLKEEKEAKEKEAIEIASKLEEETKKIEELNAKLTEIELAKEEEVKKRVSLERANKLNSLGLDINKIKEKFNFENASEETFNAFVSGYEEKASEETFAQKKEDISNKVAKEAEVKEEASEKDKTNKTKFDELFERV